METILKEENESTMHQVMMDKAYELWNDSEESKKMSYERFLDKVNDELGENYFFAVITGNLNYQLENGGWIQWFDNKYSCSLQDLIDFFNQNYFKEFSEIKQLSRMLEDIDDIINLKDRGEQAIDNIDYEVRDIFEDAMRESLNNWFEDETRNLDTSYYKINTKVNEILENYFTQKNLDEINGENNK